MQVISSQVPVVPVPAVHLHFFAPLVARFPKKINNFSSPVQSANFVYVEQVAGNTHLVPSVVHYVLTAWHSEFVV